MNIEKKTINPDQAEKWLKRNHANRPIKKRNLDYLINEITSGNWKLTGETIKLDKQGNLIDGQHRLKAIVLTGKPLETYVATNCEPEIFTVIDTGKMRSAADSIAIHGGAGYPNEISAIIKIVLRFKKGYFSDRNNYLNRINNDTIVNFYKRNKTRISESLETSRFVKQHLNNVSRSLVGGLYFILSELNQKRADKFFDKLATGVELKNNDAILILRNKIIQDKDFSSVNGFKTPNHIAMFFIAWNAFIRYKQLDTISFNHKTDEFPEPL